MTSLIDEPDLLVAVAPQGLEQEPPFDLAAELARELAGGPVDCIAQDIRPDRRRLQLAVLATPVVVLAVLAWAHRNMFADGYIYLHVVQNLLAGHGPVFNVGQRVEVTTSPTWTWILAVAGLTTPFPLTWIAVMLGIVFTLSGVALALFASGQLLHRHSPRAFLLPLGALSLRGPPAGVVAGVDGSGNRIDLLVDRFLSGDFGEMGRTVREVLPRSALVILGMGYLIRPELMIDSIVFVAAVLLANPGQMKWRGCCRVIGLAFTVPLLYEIFRMGYYGQLFANTASTKEAAMLSPGRGVHYFSDFVAPYWLFIPVGALLVGAYYPFAAAFHHDRGQRRSHVALLALPTAGALNAVYIILIGGDYIHAQAVHGPVVRLLRTRSGCAAGQKECPRSHGDPLGDGVCAHVPHH